jgi:hypothetical protein
VGHDADIAVASEGSGSSHDRSAVLYQR